MREVALSEAKNTLPLAISPDGDTSVAGLVAWVNADRDAFQRRLTTHGAVLFRGFDVNEPLDFEKVARAVDPGLKNDYLGTSPRDAVTDYVFSASELPGYYPIPVHCEMTFVKEPPRRLFFSCMVAPTGAGGETPLCDFRRVAQDLDPAVRARFRAKGVRIVRNYCGPEGQDRFDLWKLKRWDEMFRTTDKERVEKLCVQNEFEPSWQPGGRLRLISRQTSERTHPVTGEAVWFNHSQVFHLSSAASEYARIRRRQRPLQSLGLETFARVMTAVKRRRLSSDEQAMHATFGDGTEIPDADMEAVREAIWKNMVFVPWQRGDIIAIDNFAVAHGRMPYRGPRQVVVCWA